jgi:hypothetical protein
VSLLSEALKHIDISLQIQPETTRQYRYTSGVGDCAIWQLLSEEQELREWKTGRNSLAA